MELDLVYKCECSPNFTFKNKYTYNNHLSSKKHLKWENETDIKNYKVLSTENDNIIMSYKIKLRNVIEENNKLKQQLYIKKDCIEYYLKNYIIIHIIMLCVFHNR